MMAGGIKEWGARDHNGNELHIGDTVLCRFVVIALHPLMVRTEFPDDEQTVLAVLLEHVNKIARGA